MSRVERREEILSSHKIGPGILRYFERESGRLPTDDEVDELAQLLAVGFTHIAATRRVRERDVLKAVEEG